MDDISRSQQDIMERVRQRKLELSSAEKENYEDTVPESEALAKAKPEETQVKNAAESDEIAVTDKATVESQSERGKRFSMLAQELAETEYDFTSPSSLPKEAFMKGRSPRLSFGEYRSPTKSDEPPLPTKTATRSPMKAVNEERRIHFAHPIAATAIMEDDSSMYSPVNANDSSIISGWNRGRFDETNDSRDDVGAHTFLTRKTPSKSSTTSLQMCSPKPFRSALSHSTHSPVQFNPVTTSSPKLTNSDSMSPSCITWDSSTHSGDVIDELKRQADDACGNMTTAQTSQLKSSSLISTSAVSVATPSYVHSTTSACGSAKSIAMKFDAQAKSAQISSVVAQSTPTQKYTPTLPTGVQTQWRGGHNTPVVTGATAETAKVEPPPGSGNLQKLKNRWEFSSLTGTPLHPDETEDDLVRAAIRIKETSSVSIRGRLTSRLVQSSNTSSSPHEKRSITTSPPPKSLRYIDNAVPEENCKQTPSPLVNTCKDVPHEQKHYQHPDNLDDLEQKVEEPEVPDGDEEELIESSSDDENENGKSPTASRIIEQAFDFMDATKYDTPNVFTPSSAKSATSKPESASPHKASVQSSSETPLTTKSIEDQAEVVDGRSRLPYSVSFYRKRARQVAVNECGERIDLNTVIPSAPSQQVIGGGSDDSAAAEHLKSRLAKEIEVQEQRISQASRALRYCKDTEQFRGSREEVDAHRALLIASETRRALIAEIDRVNNDGDNKCDGPRGAINISHLTVSLLPEFIHSHASHSPEDVFYFIALLKYRSEVHATTLLTSDDAVRKKGVLDFTQYIQLKNVPPNFVCCVEVYGLKTKRERISHEEKYRLKGGTAKSKTLSAMMAHGGPSAVVDSSFVLCGRMSFDLNVVSRRPYSLHDIHVSMPVTSELAMKLKKHAMDKSDTQHRGFLSMYQRTKEGLGSWNRYWCVLENGEMKFWRSPEDESNEKAWLVLLDLSTCAAEGASIVREACPFPNSFHVDVWIPKEGSTSSSRNIEKLRVMLAADTKSDLNMWLSVINRTTTHLLLWNPPVVSK